MGDLCALLSKWPRLNGMLWSGDYAVGSTWPPPLRVQQQWQALTCFCVPVPAFPAHVQLCHGKILDTVALFPHPKGPPARSKLRVLATRVSGD